MDEGANLLCYLMADLPVETENARHLPPLAIYFQRSGATQESRGNGLSLA